MAFPFIIIPVISLVIMQAAPVRSQGLFEESLYGADTTGTSLAGASTYSSPLHGFIRTPLYMALNENDALYMQSIYALAGLSADLSMGKMGNAYAEVRFRNGQEFGENIKDFSLREGWVKVYTGPVGFCLGKQIKTAGNTSFINPTMQYSPMDPAVRSPDPDDLYLGTWMAEARLNITSTSSLEFSWYPLHTPSRLLTTPSMLPGYVTLNTDSEPDTRLKKSSLGIMYDLRTSVMDLQLSFFHGFRNSPWITADSVAFNIAGGTPELVNLSTEPYRINSAGICATLPLGSYIIRAEGNWLDPAGDRDYEGALFPEISYVLEIEQSGNYITAIGGYYGKYIVDFEKPGTDSLFITGAQPDLTGIFPPGMIPDETMIAGFFREQVSGFNRLYNYQRVEFYHAAYGIISLSVLQDRLTIEIPGMYNFSTEEITLSPSLEIAIADGLKLKTGGMFLRGPDGSLLGLAGPELNAFYISLEARF